MADDIDVLNNEENAKNLNSDNAIVGKDSGNILFKKENNSILFREVQKSIIERNVRKYNSIYGILYKLKEKLGIEFTVNINNYFEELETYYENRVLLNSEPFKSPNIVEGITVSGELTSGYIILNRVRDVMFDEISLEGVTSCTRGLKLRIEYSEDKNTWKEYRTFSMDSPEQIQRTQELCLMRFELDRGNDSGGTFSLNNYLFRGTNNIVLTKVNLYDASKYEWSGNVSSNLGTNWFYRGTTTFPKEIKLENGASLYVPGSANWWGADFYGYIIDPLRSGNTIARQPIKYRNLSNHGYYGTPIALPYKFYSSKVVRTNTKTMYVRYKIIGNGTINVTGTQNFKISARGEYITNEIYASRIDDASDIYVTSISNNTLNCSRGLLHKDNFYKTNVLTRNHKQTITLNMNVGLSNKIQILKEVYTNNFIDNLKLKNFTESGFLLFSNNNIVKPSIKIPGKIKQLLNEYKGKFINKKIIKHDTNLAKFGYEIINGINKYNSECVEQGNVVDSDLDKITFNFISDNKFNEFIIDEPVDISINDINKNVIFNGEINLRKETNVNESRIINLIKNNKTFYKGSIIIYDNITEEIEELAKSLWSGNSTPQDVYLVCSNSNDSNIENCYFNKNELGQNLFKNLLLKALKNNVGMQFTSIEEIFSIIDEHINDCIGLSEKISLNNLVGFNIYNFTDNEIQTDFVNRYGYYINNVNNNFISSKEYKYYGTSENNTIEEFIQFDVGKQFQAELDFENEDISSIDVLVEDDDTGNSMTINHKNNICWNYIVGEEEIILTENEGFSKKYTVALRELEDGKKSLRLATNFNFGLEDVGEHNITVNIKEKNCIKKSFIMDFVVDVLEPSVNKFTLTTTNEINESDYFGNREIIYSDDTFFELGINLDSVYDFDITNYKIVIKNKKDNNYKVERRLKGKWQSKILTFHFDDLKDDDNLTKKLRFGEWECELIRESYNHVISKDKINLDIDIKASTTFIATPVDIDIEDINNDGLQQGRDIYINFMLNKSDKIKKLRDFIYFCKEVRFLSNNVNYTKNEDYFTFRNESSLNSITYHENSVFDNNLKTSVRWLLSGKSENSSNSFLKPIANLAGDSKMIKNIKLQFVMWDNSILETLPIQIGTEGITSTPIIYGSEEHYQKLLRIESKTSNVQVDEIDEEIKNKLKEKLKSLGEFNYSKQQTVDSNKIFVFYSNLIEIQFDFGNAEFYSITDSNTVADMIPVTKDGKIRYVIDENTVDEKNKGKISIRGFIQLTDGTIISSDERIIEFIRKRKPSLVQTGDDYTKYIQYKIENHYYHLKTVIQSKIELENANNMYSSKWINHITADLVDVDKRTVIANGPKVQFYDGFIPQRFIFDSGLTSEDIKNIKDDERINVEETKKYKEIEKILNEKLFSTGKYEDQTFYLRFKAVETTKNYFGEEIEVYGEESFYPVRFVEQLKELVIIPASGVISIVNNVEENFYTYKNKVSFILESNNAEYFMYRTDRTSSFQKIYPKKVGTVYTTKIVLSTYDVGNNILEVKQKALGETESNIYSIIVEKLNYVTPPKIISKQVTDENPFWTLVPTSESDKYEYSVITEEKEHTKKKVNAVQYDLNVEPEYYLNNGYHIFQVESIDKIGNKSDKNYFISRKIGRPTPGEIKGDDSTSNDFIEWSWESQIFDGVSKYEIEINGTDKKTVNASVDGYNKYVIRHFQGKDIFDGSYEIRVWSINELGNKSYNYSSYITKKGTKIKELSFDFYTFREDYTNKLEVIVTSNDEGTVKYEYEILKNDNGKLESVTGILETKNKIIPFLDKNGNEIKLENGQYYFNIRAVNNIGEKTEFIMKSFNFRKLTPEKPFIYYLKNINKPNPVIFVKESISDLIHSIEIKIGDNDFEKIRNNVWRSNYSIKQGISNIVFRVTDYAGNIAEYSDFIEVSSNGKSMFQDDYIADMNNPLLYLNFNLPQMSNFGHNNFKIEQDNLGVNIMVETRNANNIELPLSSKNIKFPDGKYTFTIKLYDELTNGFDYIVDHFIVTLDSNKPEKPFFLNSGYDSIEYNKQYTKSRNPRWIWQVNDLTNLSKYIVDLHVYDEILGQYVEYSNGQYNNFSTQLSGEFQTQDELKDGIYRLTVKSIGINKLESDSEVFFFVVKNTIPKPPCFDLNKEINKKYENRNKNITWEWYDPNSDIDKLIKYKLKINDDEFSDEFGSNITYYEEKRILEDGKNTIYVIGCDKAGNWSTSSVISASQYGNNYFSHTKIIDTKKPDKISERDIEIKITDSQSFEVFFKNDKQVEEYFIFELFTYDNNREEIIFVKGNTLLVGSEEIYLYNEKVEPGIEIGELTQEGTGYCEIKNNTTTNIKDDISLYFTNMPNNIYYLNVYGVDYAGNISEPLIKEIELQDLTKLKPKFILPKEIYTNNSTIMFQWVLNEPNIKNWEYQLITPYNLSTPDLSNDEKWKSLENSFFTLNNIPKLVGGNDADGNYTLYVRAVFDEFVTQEGTGLEVYKKSDIASITVNLDRKIPKGVYFTNKTYTTDSSVLIWSWEYTGEGDNADGVYVSFNPNIPIDEWEKIENQNTYSSFKDRNDGVYTLYLKTFDKAGNVSSDIFSNSITIDRIPPFKPVINGGSNIHVNKIPTIQWEINNNYYKYCWLIMELNDFNEFKNVYDKITKIENYSMTNDDWAYVFHKGEEYSLDNVNSELRNIGIIFNKNDELNENQITLNCTESKNGISEDGEYVFLLSGFDQNYNWAEEFEYQFITYDTTAPDVSKIKFISPKYTVTTERRPKWEWVTPTDVVKCEYVLEKNGYSDGTINGILTKNPSEENETFNYNFSPEYNLTKGDYRLIVDCYDAAGNNIQITKNVIIEDSSTELETQFFDVFLPGINNVIRCKMNKYSNSYIIIDSTLNKNSVLMYRSKSSNKGYKVYEIGVDELSINEDYEFNLTTYNVEVE